MSMGSSNCPVNCCLLSKNEQLFECFGVWWPQLSRWHGHLGAALSSPAQSSPIGQEWTCSMTHKLVQIHLSQNWVYEKTSFNFNYHCNISSIHLLQLYCLLGEGEWWWWVGVHTSTSHDQYLWSVLDYVVINSQHFTCTIYLFFSW